MEVQKEAQRIMTMSVWKMYHSRMQRGGLRLHRSLQLSLVMRSARELYLSAKVETDESLMSMQTEAEVLPSLPQPEGETLAAPAAAPGLQQVSEEPAPEPMETQEASGAQPAPGEPVATSCGRLPSSVSAPPRHSVKPNRKRRSSSLGQGGEASLVPSKKARLEVEKQLEEEKGEAGATDRRQPQEEGPFPSLAQILQKSFSGILSPQGGGTKVNAPPPSCDTKPVCRQGDGMISILVRAVVAF
ncbi:immediate early response gene 2 protein [Ornithorhynchus anatinus]|uniref:Immediate early response 2 n=1 Tax=Ornithorhynchus anatinus TaxID=9258 RepID=A0A6I8N3B6_ORNAN|nr:immediate early response gene 2 protein [Ornithorhynchus anatinus]XP_007667530.1 immediate early response gene 2 protein [Ornithorhynchus anatinus]XP_028908493.1 immediate early response gene 2 protein [Ornithorhynchus anatinus]